MRKDLSRCYEPPALKRGWRLDEAVENILSVVFVLAGGYGLFFLLCCIHAAMSK